MAELDGVGHRLSDNQAINNLASASGVTSESLGSTTNDLVFTPLTPCRIADTRLASGGSGPITASSSKAFEVWGTSNYAFQGGNAAGCGLSAEHPQAVVLNVTAVTPTAPGYATVYPANAASRPNISSINYVTGAVVNNTVVSPLGTVGLNDVQIYTVAQANYVIDIVGFFDAPHATPLDCTTVSGTTSSIAAGTNGQAFAPACTTGYTQTAIYCETASYDTDISNISTNYGCTFRNNTGSAVTAVAQSRCCRVPGR